MPAVLPSDKHQNQLKGVSFKLMSCSESCHNTNETQYQLSLFKEDNTELARKHTSLVTRGFDGGSLMIWPMTSSSIRSWESASAFKFLLRSSLQREKSILVKQGK